MRDEPRHFSTNESGEHCPEISVEVKQHHAETASTTTEPTIGLVQVLQQEVGDGDPEVSVEVEQQHPDHPRPVTEPTIGLVQVLQKEIGEQGGAYEEESVH